MTKQEQFRALEEIHRLCWQGGAKCVPGGVHIPKRQNDVTIKCHLLLINFNIL